MATDFVGSHYVTVANNYYHDTAHVCIMLKGGAYEADVYGNLFVNTSTSYGSSTITMGQSTDWNLFRPPLFNDNRDDPVFSRWSSLAPRPAEESSFYEAERLRVYSNVFIGPNTPFSFQTAVDCYAVNNTIIYPFYANFRILNPNVH
ncbi:MAG: hypothetical protein FWD16_04490, partial [Clostridia bacterium]|nr:hypothetical protein [Clostridia bacterium]